MERITLHVPEALNDGSPVPPEVFEAYEDELYDIALDAKISAGGLGEEGFTILVGAIGAWRSPSGTKYKEPLRLYCLDVADARPVLDALRHLAHRITTELGQEVVYLTISPNDGIAVRQYVVA